MSNRPSCLPLAPGKVHLYVGIALAILMVATRGNHVASIHALPSSSWAVFFLAGALLRPRWAFAAFFVLAVAVDFSSMSLERIGSTCLSPAYWMLLPAYALLWGAGRLYARFHVDRFSTLLRLVPLLAVTSLVAYQFSGGGFYLLSGSEADPSLAGYVDRVAQYVPQRLRHLSLYVLGAFALRAAWLALGRSGLARRGVNT